MRKTFLRTAFALVAAAVVLAAPAPASAQTSMDRIVDRPAATLLLPYFEVGLDGGTDTRFTVNNASATAVLAHVTVWSDLAVPVLAFNIYLTGYDVQQVSMRDILVNGRLPRTASAGQDPADFISNKGLFSQDINFASCSGQLPPPALPGQIIAHARNSLTGQRSAIMGGCAGRPSGNVARGFVTVDTVNNCTLRVPGDVGYFGAGGTGDATNQNVLWGDFLIVSPGAMMRGDALVHITASATDPETSVPGEYTFYGRHVAWTAADNRQPLATSWAAPFRKNGPSGDASSGAATDFPTSSIIVWRDPKVDQDFFTCGSNPSWYPLTEEGVAIFNEAEDTSGTAVLNTFPAATQRVNIGPASGIPTPYGAGWMYLNLNHASANPPEDPLAAGSFVYVIRDKKGFYSHGTRATALDSATTASHSTP